MTDVKTIINDIIEREGGFVNLSQDKGGATKYGITHRTLSEWRGRQVSVNEVENLSKETAFRIYLHDYYVGPGIDKLPDEIKPIMTDMAVNHGPKKSIKLLQDVLNVCDFNLIVDGVCGEKTINAAEELYEKIGDDLIHKLVERRKAFYESIVDHDPTQAIFLDGWRNRANSFLT